MRAAKCTVIARPVRKLVVAIRFLYTKKTDSHTSDIGHWFGMTGSFICSARVFYLAWMLMNSALSLEYMIF